ncbi:homeobox protein MIXL1-like [Oryctolagus cuniculus]|uniref:homeobox protein MIXL1-like n=1 Tax=Oryctolagus cuniculus TaxID=9986 RepID=UPI0038799C0B
MYVCTGVRLVTNLPPLPWRPLEGSGSGSGSGAGPGCPAAAPARQPREQRSEPPSRCGFEGDRAPQPPQPPRRPALQRLRPADAQLWFQSRRAAEEEWPGSPARAARAMEAQGSLEPPSLAFPGERAPDPLWPLPLLAKLVWASFPEELGGPEGTAAVPGALGPGRGGPGAPGYCPPG